MASETVYQINYANVSDVYSALTVSAMPVPVNAAKQIALCRKPANHDIHHESRHACAGGVCLVESNY